jgi:uncharacterized membrane protein YjjB (DUF3815 family)
VRIANWFMAAFFGLSAVAQYNDPDGLLWAATYAFPTIMSVLFALGKRNPLPWLGVIGFGAWSIRLLPNVGGDWWHNELAREGLGLLIAAIWMTVLGIVWARGRKVS